MNRFLLLPLLASLIGFSIVDAQQRYLVSPDGEVRPLQPGEGSQQLIDAVLRRSHPTSTAICGDKFTFGTDPGSYPTNSNFGSAHRDVIGQWFTAKASGTIDSIFWVQMAGLGAYDSTVYVRVHSSHVGPDYGPGVRPGPFQPGCQSWGYWINTNDSESGITAFPETATDSSWVSTLESGSVPSTPPIGAERWGYGGFQKKITPNEINHVAMEATGDTIGVTVGENIFVSLEIAGCDDDSATCSTVDPKIRTEMGAVSFNVSASDEDYPSRMWKYYNQYSNPTCYFDIPSPGWYARWGYNYDTLNVSLFNIWYSMTVTTNVPPIVITLPEITRTFFEGGSEPIGATVVDCDPENPLNAGIESVILMHEINGVSQPDIPMDYLGADYWELMYPLPPAPATVLYQIKAVDLTGASSIGRSQSFNVVSFGKTWYGIDTGVVCVPVDISSTGTYIDTSEFFDPLSPGTVDKDDGIAGPLELGGTMRLFGDEYRYAWISVDGAIGLGQSAADTVKIVRSAMQENFLNLSAAPSTPGIDVPVIAPLYGPFIVGDTTGQYGSIKYGSNGDPCLFIVQWDSIGEGPWPNVGSPAPTTFRVVLNRCLGTVEFQYDQLVFYGGGLGNVVGLQNEPFSTPDYSGNVFVNRMGYPIETRPRDGWCIRFYPRNPEPEGDNWNLVSISVLPNDGDYSAANLFPGGPVYDFIGYYTSMVDSLRPGRGYWMKNIQSGVDGAPGVFFDNLSVPVQDKWNLIGGTSGSSGTGPIIATGGTIVSSFFGYGISGYYTAGTIEPGRGYWLKMSGAGTLEMHSSVAAPKSLPDNGLTLAADFGRLTTLKLSDASGQSQTLYIGEEASHPVGGVSASATDASMFELPPPVPGGIFDARFSSGRMLESYLVDDSAQSHIFPIAISGGAGPATIRWDVSGGTASGFTPSLEVTRDGVVRNYPMDKQGAITLGAPALVSVIVSPRKADGFPEGFALSSNYPNPFNPSTTIEYTLPVGSRVTIVVFNLAGEEVARLADAEMPAGYHSVSLDATNSPSGVYFCRMTAGTYRGVRKMLLLK